MNGFWEQIVIDRSVPIPLYFQLKEAVKRAIKQKQLQIGEQIPPETQLCDLLHLSRPTVHQALTTLVSEGYLARNQGHAVYVANPKVSGDFLKRLQNFSSEMHQVGMKPSTQVLRKKIIIDNTNVNEQLGLPLGEPCFYLERLRSADGFPLVYLETYLPYKRFEGIAKVDFESNSLYDTLETEYNTPVYCAKRQIEAVNADVHIAKLLDVPKGAAICFVKTIGYDQQGVPIEYSVAHYRGDRNRFTVTLYNGQSL